MALEQILQALDAQAETEIAEIQAQARAQAEEIVSRARVEAQEIRQAILDAIVPRIDAEWARRINAARLEAQRARLETRESLVNAAFEEAARRLAGLREQPDYGAILWALISEAVQEMGHDVRLLADDRDVELIHRQLQEHGIVADVEPALNCWGGVVAESRDGRITLDNTLATRLERIRELYRGQVAAMLTQSAAEGPVPSAAEGPVLSSSPGSEQAPAEVSEGYRAR